MTSEDVKEIKKYLGKAYRGTLERILLNILKTWSIEKAKAAIRWGHYDKEEEVEREKLERNKSPKNSPLRLIKSNNQNTPDKKNLHELEELKEESRTEFINAGPVYPYPFREQEPQVSTTMVKSEINRLNEEKIEKLDPDTVRVMLCDVLYGSWQIEDAELLIRRAEIEEKLDRQDEYSESYINKLGSEYNTITARLKKKKLI